MSQIQNLPGGKTSQSLSRLTKGEWSLKIKWKSRFRRRGRGGGQSQDSTAAAALAAGEQSATQESRI